MKDKFIISKKTGNIIFTGVESAIPEGPEKRYLALINGAEPQSESEKSLQEQIKEIAAKGYIVDIPSG